MFKSPPLDHAPTGRAALNISVVVLGLFGAVLPQKAIPAVPVPAPAKSAFAELKSVVSVHELPFHTSTFARKPGEGVYPAINKAFV